MSKIFVNKEQERGSEKQAEEQSSYSAVQPTLWSMLWKRKPKISKNEDGLNIIEIRHLSQLPEIELGYSGKISRGRSNSRLKIGMKLNY